MSVQDKIERILKEIHVLFSKSQTYGPNDSMVVIEKQKVFELLEQLNVAVYEVMDEYEVTSQKHELSERRSQKRGEEIVGRANRHADDIYAASIMYTDDALSRIQNIMEDANKSVQRIFRKMSEELTDEKDQIRQNQSELREQLQDFADTQKYLKLIEENNQQREKELREKIEKTKGKRIQNEGKSYSAIQPEIKVNKAYFDQTGRHYDENGYLAETLEEDEISESLSKVTGKEFAESLRRRAAMSSELYGGKEESPKVHTAPEVKVNLDAAYFKKKPAKEENSGKRFSFGKK